MTAVLDQRRPDPQQGVFETLLVFEGHPIELDAHLARLAASLAELFPDRLASDPQEEIGRLAAGVSMGSLRVAVAPKGTTAFETQIELRKPPLGAFLSLSDRKVPRRIELDSLELADGLGEHKWVDRSLLDGAQAELPESALPLVVDRGAVLEASRANVFAVRNGDLLTPPTDGRILPGVTRARVLTIAAAAGMEARETELSADDLFGADEVFLTGSVRGVERVHSLDGVALSTAGEVSSNLAGELRQAWVGAQVG